MCMVVAEAALPGGGRRLARRAGHVRPGHQPRPRDGRPGHPQHPHRPGRGVERLPRLDLRILDAAADGTGRLAPGRQLRAAGLDHLHHRRSRRPGHPTASEPRLHATKDRTRLPGQRYTAAEPEPGTQPMRSVWAKRGAARQRNVVPGVLTQLDATACGHRAARPRIGTHDQMLIDPSTSGGREQPAARQYQGG